ncbi:MAG TPA: BON domain-containing protein [Bryobacteraceae bacterium]|jgi:hyperosmotically inducible periplasmic protein|nr:BON domain-containing protein [Bryobacteraceae bacterium]
MRKILLQSILALGASGMLVMAQTAPPSQTQGTGQGAPTTDSQMTSKVHAALMNDTNVGSAASHIRVTTKNGVVTLHGRVQTTAERDAAVAKAKQIAGDANVKDNLTVSKP